jgi:hypothetical protein
MKVGIVLAQQLIQCFREFGRPTETKWSIRSDEDEASFALHHRPSLLQQI